MSIIRVAARNQYLVIDHMTASDVSLSWEAKGLHVYLLSRPDNWEVNPEQLAKVGSAGRDKMYRMLNELIKHGYAVRNTIKSEIGRIVDHEYLIYESPLPENTEVVPCPEKPEVVIGALKPCSIPLPEKPEVEPLTEKPEVDKRNKKASKKPLPEKPEVVFETPLPGFPDTEKPDRENQDHKYLTNTENKLILNSPSEVQLSIPRESSASALPATAKNPNGISAISIDWRPRDNFADMLAFAGLKDYPWEDDLPEFVLFRLGHDERMSQGSWEHKFVQTLKRNSYQRSVAGNKPTQIPVDWEPPRDVVAALLQRGMTHKFLDDQLLEFVSFWRDAGNYASSWTAKFIKHVNRQHELRAQARDSPTTAFDRLTDTSWAKGLVKDSDAELFE